MSAHDVAAIAQKVLAVKCGLPFIDLRSAPNKIVIAWDEFRALAEEIEALRHDIERHIRIAADLATENERLRVERRPPGNS